MKKLLIIITLLFLLTSCKPYGMNDNIYKGCISAIETMDDYFDYKTSKNDTKTKLNDIYDRIDNLKDLDFKNSLNQTSILISINSFNIFNDDNKKLELRNELADLCGESKK